MAQAYKTLDQQMRAMRSTWPEFDVAALPGRRVGWFGSLIGIARPYRVMIEYGAPPFPDGAALLTRIPLVRILTPRLEPQWLATDEAPLPHVFFDPDNLPLSPLCLFDPACEQWSPNDLIARTTVPWTVDWLACYEGWLATGRWHGGGRHAPSSSESHP